jgi:aconitate hydratase
VNGGLDTLKTRRQLKVGAKTYDYYSLAAAEKAGLGKLAKLPVSLKVLLENLLRHQDERTVTVDDVKAVARWLRKRSSTREIAYRPARVLMQDFTGVPAVVDLAAMRGAMKALGKDPRKINPLSPVDLVIDHSVMVDAFGSPRAFKENVVKEYERNRERYAFLRWGQEAFDNFRVVPPGTGICHQVNLEYLAQTVWTSAQPKSKKTRSDKASRLLAYPDTLVGTDSHTTMVNALAVLGWGVGGIEAEAAMLGQPISMLIPEVIGFKLTGSLKEGTTATDLVLTVTQMLRKRGVVNKFVEYYGPGLDSLALADRATLANMAPEYGATCGFFPIDQETIRYLKATGRPAARVALVEAYARAQGMWRDATTPDPAFTDTLALDMAKVEPSLAGPRRPQDRVALGEVRGTFEASLKQIFGKPAGVGPRVQVNARNYDLGDGDVVIAAITSCTNTSNPTVMLGAGLVARNAVKHGLETKPWVKTSLAPGSKVVTDYLTASGLQRPLDKLGFNLVGYGCTTCIGNSGPLSDSIGEAIAKGDLVVASVLSGNRNFEGRINPLTRANYLASPMLVVAYALAGTVRIDFGKDPIGRGKNGPVYLRDIWPSNAEMAEAVGDFVKPAMFREQYGDVFAGDKLWQSMKTPTGLTYQWDPPSTYVRNPPYFDGFKPAPDPLRDVKGARILALLGDSITTDHISPAGSIKKTGPAGLYLTDHDVSPDDFNSYGARRGNHEVMVRGTFANIRLRNEMVPGIEGGITKHMPDAEVLPIYDAAMRYRAEGVPLVVFAGKEYGTGSSRDWAAKGTRLLGVRAVVVESFERIHRSNLVGMGVLPLQFKPGMDRKTLGLDGTEKIDIEGLEAAAAGKGRKGGFVPGMQLRCRIRRANGVVDEIDLINRIDTVDEIEYFKHGGILPYVLRQLMAAA